MNELRNKGLFYKDDNNNDIFYSFPIELQNELNQFSISYDIKEDVIYFKNCNAVDLLGLLYTTSNSMIKNNKELFGDLPNCYIKMVNDYAIMPTKAHLSDVGYDVTIISQHKKLNSKTFLYDTGIQLAIEIGYYIEIVPRSSLSKSGYMLANSLGIIDASYRGNIYIALIKIVDEAEDIQLPFRCCQFIVRKQYDMTLVVNRELDTTYRSDGGFGST
jgi:deoxyuridine 5'-triphosphate nucleotidohydrolase